MAVGLEYRKYELIIILLVYFALSQGSPALYRNVNSLRERISAFQSAFHSIKENKKMTGCPEFSEAGKESEMTDLSE